MKKKKKKDVLQTGLYLTQHKKKKKKKKKKLKIKISESSTLSLQGDVREYIDTVYYGTFHIL
jgi:hypothetical protein